MQPTVVYDGDCAICEASAGWIKAHVPAVEVVSHHQYGITHIDAVWLVTENSRLEGAQAISAVLKLADSGAYRMVGVFISVPFVSTVAKIVYALIARNRHRISIFLGMNACGLSQR